MENLQIYLSNLLVWNVKLHNFHWNVVGKEFKEVHMFTQALYECVDQQYDEVAELMKMRNKFPLGTVKDYLSTATIAEVKSKAHSVEEVFNAIETDMKLMKDLALVVHEQAEKADDVTLSAKLEEYIAYFEEKLWMIRATLKE